MIRIPGSLVVTFEKTREYGPYKGHTHGFSPIYLGTLGIARGERASAISAYAGRGQCETPHVHPAALDPRSLALTLAGLLPRRLCWRRYLVAVAVGVAVELDEVLGVVPGLADALTLADGLGDAVLGAGEKVP